ncbi:hypothetical protein TI03_03370, partial [Achromatium sp. WMS1]
AAMVNSKEADVDGSYSAYYPTIRGSGSVGSIDNTDPLLRDGRKQVIGLELVQPIPIFGRERALVNAAKATLEAEKANFGQVRQEIIYEILDTSFQVASLRNTVRLRAATEQLLRTRVKSLHEAVQNGGARITDLKLAQSELSQATSLSANAEAEYRALTVKLITLLPNFDPKTLLMELKLERLGVHPPESVDQAILIGKQNAIAIRKAKADLERASAERDVSEANIWPQFTLNLQVQKGAFGDISQDSTGVFLGLNAPLFEGGSRWSAAKSAAYRFNSAQEALQAEILGLERRIRELWTRWQALKAVASFWHRSITEQEAVLAFTKEQMLGGGATKLDVSKAEEMVLESRLLGINQRLEHDRALLKLLLEIGELHTL